MKEQEVLSISDLSFGYEKSRDILSGVNLSLKEGEILGILGASGIGKSSLLRIISGLEVPKEGEILFEGRLLNKNNLIIPPNKRGVGLVVQEKALFPHLTVLENIKFGIKGPKSKKNDQATYFLRLLKAEKFKNSMPNKLSGGEQQRVAIARALAPQPKLILLDEPFSSLDMNLRAELRLETRELLKRTNTACIIVSHDLDDVSSFCDKAARLENGKIKEIST
tara:strand:+ start:3017 stop:3685 length:669 start_codon:yes stop_codon:yes gene_type:complete